MRYEDVEFALRTSARRLLAEQTVDVFIGYESSRLPLRTTPSFIRDVSSVDRLVWNPFCTNNLTKYLLGSNERIGVVAKSCDIRSMLVAVAEKQVAREKVTVVAVPCTGMVDRKKVEASVQDEILKVSFEEDSIKLVTEGSNLSVDKKPFLCDSCLTCKRRNPLLYDVLLSDFVEEIEVDEFAEVKTIEAMTLDDRWGFFSEQLKDCIRCYACRNVCPLCYCKVCFIDSSTPVWVNKKHTISSKMVYHLVRVLHMAGRCVDCGACNRACPMGINLRLLTKKMEKEVRAAFGYEPGLRMDVSPLLAVFTKDDPQEFIV